MPLAQPPGVVVSDGVGGAVLRRSADVAVTGTVRHLLLGALSLPDDPTARESLTSVHLTPQEEVRAAIGRGHSNALAAVDIATDAGLATSSSAGARRLKGPYRSTGLGQEVFRRAVALSKEDTPAVLRAAHVVLAVAEQEHGIVARALGTLGIDHHALSVATRTTLAGRRP